MEFNIKNKSYNTKAIAMSIKDIDTPTRRVKIALASFDTLDSDRDVIRKGAFSKSIQERGVESSSNRKIAFLRYHDWEHQIGKFISLEETDFHLVGVAELGRSTKGDDAFLDYQDGIIREHSIGFNYIQDKMQLVGEGEQSYWDIKEVVLWEGSAVTFGANMNTPMFDVAKGNKEDVLKALSEKMEGCISALRNGKGTDDRLHGIEMSLKQIKTQYEALMIVKDVKTEILSKEIQAKDFFINLR